MPDDGSIPALNLSPPDSVYHGHAYNKAQMDDFVNHAIPGRHTTWSPPPAPMFVTLPFEPGVHEGVAENVLASVARVQQVLGAAYSDTLTTLAAYTSSLASIATAAGPAQTPASHAQLMDRTFQRFNEQLGNFEEVR